MRTFLVVVVIALVLDFVLFGGAFTMLVIGFGITLVALLFGFATGIVKLVLGTAATLLGMMISFAALLVLGFAVWFFFFRR